MKAGMTKALAVLPLIAALAACGGGGGGDSGPATPAGLQGTGDTSRPKVKAAFVKGQTARYLMISSSAQNAGRLETIEQQTTGEVITMNGNALSGIDRAIADVAGDASFTIGRWTHGSAVIGSSTKTLGATGTAVHYAVYNAPDALPTSGSFSCDAGQFTVPTLDVAPGTEVGQAKGSASLSFDASGAQLDASITVTLADGSAGTESATGRKLNSPTTITYTGGMLGGSSGLQLTMAQGLDASKQAVIVGYVVKVGASKYRGVAIFNCSK